MDNTHYGFVRAAGDVPNYQLLQQSGTGGLLFNPDDAGWEQGYQKAIAAGMKAGIWIPAYSNAGDPSEYAKRMAFYSQKYNPSIIVPDMEFAQKGDANSQQWQWNDAMMQAFRQLAPNQNAAVTVMPNQGGMFNYGAYTSRGAPVWAQAYGATLDQQFDPAQVYQNLLNAGVPANMAQVVLAATQNPGSYKGQYSRYTVDDLLGLVAQGKPLPQYTGQVGGQAGAGGQVGQPQTPSVGNVTAQSNSRPAPAPGNLLGLHQYQRHIDPKANAYIKAGLARLRKLGYTPKQFGLQGADPRDIWASMSSILGARQAAAKGAAYQTRAGTNAGVASAVQKVLAKKVIKRTVKGGRQAR